MSVQRHPYADHPAASVLADHYLATIPRSPAQRVLCACRWTGPSCDHPAHQTEMLDQARLLTPGTPADTDMDLAQVVAELSDIYRSAVTESETGNPWRGGYVAGYVRAMRTALTIAGGTPPHPDAGPSPETPTRRADLDQLINRYVAVSELARAGIVPEDMRVEERRRAWAHLGYSPDQIDLMEQAIADGPPPETPATQSVAPCGCVVGGIHVRDCESSGRVLAERADRRAT